MARYYGVIGYVGETIETSPGSWTEQIIERPYKGELLRSSRRLQSTENLNDNINISNEISIVSDPYALENIFAMRYLTFLNTKWKITNVEVRRPRLILTIGGVYNGE